ncbi:MAG: protein serine/threonine phosphatase [Rhodospirillaceae bacterium]|nr:MAG: protein serine/threonine phosphatase [Rhodospirillaceae bacterium]
MPPLWSSDVQTLPPGGVEDVAREWIGLPVRFPPRPGETIDGFRILRRLYNGLQGTVLAAVDDTNGREVALKFPDPLATADPAWLERFARKEWAGLKMRHPNVVRVISQPPGRRSACYYVLEFLEGQTLTATLAMDRPTPEQVANWLRQAARGVLALHRRGLVHRDIKPDNLFLCREGRVVVVDFGTVRIEGLPPIAAHQPGRQVVGGTPGFMAPELYAGERGTPASDIFALGVTGYWLLTGHMPYGTPEPPLTPRFDPPPLLTELRADIPPTLAAALERCLSPTITARPGDVGELLAWLDTPPPPPCSIPPRFVPLVERLPPRFYRVGFWGMAILCGGALLKCCAGPS